MIKVNPVFSATIVFTLFMANCSSIPRLGASSRTPESDLVRIILPPKVRLVKYNLKESKTIPKKGKSTQVLIPTGEKKLQVDAVFAKDIYYYVSEAAEVPVNGKAGDVILFCSKIVEGQDLPVTGGYVPLDLTITQKVLSNEADIKRVLVKNKVVESSVTEMCAK
jgi:hypothetical protein